MFNYDPNMSFFKWASTFSNSAVRKAAWRLEFWLFIAVHFCTWYWKDLPDAPDVTDDARLSLSWNTTSVVASMSTFFLVLYVNLVFTRYGQIYYFVRLMFDGAWTTVWEMKIHCKAKDSKWLRLCTRYLSATLMIVLYDPRSVRCEVPEREWDKLVALQLLGPEEVIVLRPLLREQAGAVTLHWTARVVMAFAQDVGLSNQMYRSILDRIYWMRRVQQQAVDSVRLLMPFPYFHFVNLVLVLNLGVLAYAYAMMTSVFAPIGFFILLVAFAATIELNANLADPLRHREIDFPMRPWLAKFISEIMHFQGFDGAADEHAPCEERIWWRIGKAGRGYPSIVDLDDPIEDDLWMRQCLTDVDDKAVRVARTSCRWTSATGPDGREDANQEEEDDGDE